MNVSRYDLPVNLEYLNDSRTLAVLLTEPGSLVLDIGCAAGSVARALLERGCRVWGIELDLAAARQAEQWCERVLIGDVETMEWAANIGDIRFDRILLLDVLEHLYDPVSLLRQASKVLMPNGDILASLPNVTHAAVALQLVNGRFRRTETGLLDRTHRHLFDRPAVKHLFEQAALRLSKEFRVVKTIDETEIVLDADTGQNLECIKSLCTHADADTYQFVVVARPDTMSGARETRPSLSERLQQALHVTEQRLVDLEKQNESLRRASEEARGSTASLGKALSAALLERDLAVSRLSEVQQRLTSADEITRLNEDRMAALSLDLSGARRALEDRGEQLKHMRAELTVSLNALNEQRREVFRLTAELDKASADGFRWRQRETELERMNIETSDEHSRLALQMEQLGHDLVVKEAYITALRQAVAEFEAAFAPIDVGTDPSARREAINELFQQLTDLRLTLEKREGYIRTIVTDFERSREEISGYQETLGLPRYRIADRLNSLLRRVRPLHLSLKWLISQMISKRRMS